MTRPIGKFARFAMERQRADLKTGRARGMVWDGDAADRVVAWVEKLCKHHKGEWAGKPLMLEEWQKDEVLRPIFGWKRADGTRRFRTAYVEIPRKNGKTEIAGAVGLYLMIGDSEPGAEVYVTATKRDQAKIAWQAASAMVKQSTALKRFVKTYTGNLSCERLGSKMEPLGADSNTLDGLNPSGVLVDELHAHTDNRVWSVMQTALGARRQPLTLAITTAGVYDPDSIGWQQHEYAQKVLEGIFTDDSFFAYIAAADEGDDPFAPETWARANPNLGVSLKADYLAEQAAKAKVQPSQYNEFLRLHLNIWTQQVNRWLSVEKWNACDGTPHHLPDFQGRVCYAGLDLSTKKDLTALALLFPRDDGALDVVCRFYLPEATLTQHRKQGKANYDEWQKAGWLTVTPGDVIDYEFIRRDLMALSQSVRLVEVAYDPWNATQIATQLQEDGFAMVETRQGPRSLSEPAKEFEARIISGRIRHGGNPVLRWNVANAVIRTDANGNIAPDKEKASDKIDGVVACIMAMSRIIVAQDSFPYTESRGFQTL